MSHDEFQSPFHSRSFFVKTRSITSGNLLHILNALRNSLIVLLKRGNLKTFASIRTMQCRQHSPFMLSHIRHDGSPIEVLIQSASFAVVQLRRALLTNDVIPLGSSRTFARGSPSGLWMTRNAPVTTCLRRITTGSTPIPTADSAVFSYPT
jgi:hypothetical protein